MNEFTFEEINLLCIYDTGTRMGLVAALEEMRGFLEPDENELRAMTDADYAGLELFLYF